MSPEKLHITLAFLHSVDAAQIPAIIDAARVIKIRPFNVVLRSVGYWYRSRILWLGPGAEEDQAPVEQLAHAIWAALEPIGFVPERRPFRAHVTLARKSSAPTGLPRNIDPVCWHAREFALVESITGVKPAGYRILETFGLVGDEEPFCGDFNGS